MASTWSNHCDLKYAHSSEAAKVSLLTFDHCDLFRGVNGTVGSEENRYDGSVGVWHDIVAAGYGAANHRHASKLTVFLKDKFTQITCRIDVKCYSINVKMTLE